MQNLPKVFTREHFPCKGEAICGNAYTAPDKIFGYPPKLPEGFGEVCPFRDFPPTVHNEILKSMGELSDHVKKAVGENYPKVNLDWRSASTMERAHWDLCLDVCIMIMYTPDCENFAALHAAATEPNWKSFLKAVYALTE